MDIPSVRRPPVSVMVPADRVSAHDLPLAETLSAVEGGLFHIIMTARDVIVKACTWNFVNIYSMVTAQTLFTVQE